MRAVRIHTYGGPEVLTLDEVESPRPGPRDLLVDVHATSVNPVDWKIRKGAQRGAVRLKLPWTLGMDVSGVVREVGSEVTRFAPGDHVWSSPTHRRPGSYAEQLLVDESEAGKKPEALSHAEAAAVPLAGLTAWDCLVVAARLERGEHVLVQAGAGGVGVFAIQIAKHLGARVSTTASARNADFLRELGADEVIDYATTRFEDVVRDCDVVLESMGGEILQRSLGVLRRGGRLASINSGLPAATARFGPNLGVLATGLGLARTALAARLRHGVRFAMVVRTPSGEHLDRLAELVAAGALRPVIAERFPLERIADAHRLSETGHVRGKIVVTLR